MRHSIDTPRGSLVVEDAGSAGLPLVLVHGLTGSLAHWASQLATLPARRRVVALELPGHGNSEPPRDGDWSVEAMADALAAVVSARGLTRFELIGHSYSGNVVAHYAATHPAQVTRLVFADTGPWTPTTAELAQLREGFRPSAYPAFVDAWFEEILVGARPATRALVLSGLHAFKREHFMGLIYGSLAFDFAAAAARYPGPKLAVCAAMSGMAARWAAPVEVKVLEGVSHWLQLDSPEAFDAALEN